MTIISAIPLFVAVLGALVYLIASNDRVRQLALYAWATGLLVTLFGLAGHVVRIG